MVRLEIGSVGSGHIIIRQDGVSGRVLPSNTDEWPDNTRMSDFAYVTKAQFDKLLARVDGHEAENEALCEENTQLWEEDEELRDRVTDVEGSQDDHGMRLDALGAGIESVNDDHSRRYSKIEDSTVEW